MDRILSMILNRLVSTLIRRGINAGLSRAVGDKGQGGQPLTPEQRAQSRTAQEAMRRGRQVGSILRRLR